MTDRTIELLCPCCQGHGSVTQFNWAYLRELREQAGLSLRDVANAIGLSRPYVSDIERGLRRPDYQFEVIEQAILALSKANAQDTVHGRGGPSGEG